MNIYKSLFEELQISRDCSANEYKLLNGQLSSQPQCFRNSWEGFLPATSGRSDLSVRIHQC